VQRALFVVATALAALVLTAPGALAAESSRTETHTATSPAGEVTAELSYTKTGDFEYENVRIKITRGGQVLLDALVPAPCKDFCSSIPSGAGELDSLQLLDLNGDGEPEAIVDLFTGGAHCCLYTQLYAYRAATNNYPRLKQFWGDVGYTLKDLDGDGSPEFRSADPSFSSAFTAYVLSGFPVQIWKFGNGRLNDVTRGYKKLIKSDLKRQLGFYKQVRDDEGGDVRGFLAAYVADKYLLGQGDTAFALVYAAYRRGELKPPSPDDSSVRGKRYISELRKFLRRTGYR
jgi:hypothetical protein